MSAPAPATTTSLRLAQLRLDGGTQPRAGINQDTVDEYAEAKRNGAKFPPSIAFFDGKDYWLAAGFHRTKADKQIGRDVTEVQIREGTQRDAILFSLGENSDHGLPRTNEDKRRAVLTMLNDEEWSRFSDSLIAQTVKLSQPFVSKLRRELSAENGNSQPTARLGADGQVRETKKIGSSPRPARDVSPAETDIRVDAEPSAHSAPAKAASTNGGAAWSELPTKLDLHIGIAAGKSSKRSVLISGRAGDSKPIFLTEFTAADLEPHSPAVAALLANLAKALRRSKPKSEQKPKAKKK